MAEHHEYRVSAATPSAGPAAAPDRPQPTDRQMPDPESDNYFHQAAIYICTPAGRVARTIVKLDFDTELLNDSLINASQGKISRGLFGVAISCGLVKYDHVSGKYTWAAMALMRVVGIGTVVVMAVVIGTLVYRDSRRRRTLATSGST
jgi:protein SCO1